MVDRVRVVDWWGLLPVCVGGLLAIVGGVAGGLITQEYQARSTREQGLVDLRVREQQDAVAALQEVGSLTDARLARAVVLLQAIQQDQPDSAIGRLQSRFNETNEAWAIQRHHARILNATYFGDTSLASFDSVDSLVTDAISGLPDFLRRHSFAQQAMKAALTRPDSARLRPMAERLVRDNRATATAVLQHLSTLDVLMFARERLLAMEIEIRQTGSFDPIARFGLDPQVEAALIRRLMDSVQSAQKRLP